MCDDSRRDELIAVASTILSSQPCIAAGSANVEVYVENAVRTAVKLVAKVDAVIAEESLQLTSSRMASMCDVTEADMQRAT